MNKKIIYGIAIVLLVIIAIVVYNFKFKTYDVIFDSKAGTSIAAQRVRKGELVKKVDDPIFPGYTFLGWYLNDEKYDFNTPVHEDITLTGKWEKDN